ncbi:MAG: MobF family relaxase, partial [Candidatus Aenigmatarchaeota archaeon]
MVSLSIVKDSKYFTQVNHQSGHGMEYYAEHGIAESWWQGSLAQKQGLSGAVNEQDISRLTQGYERVGLNITFSAPKSVSLAYSLLGDTRIKEAHEQAVKTANEWLEQNLAQTRQGQGGEEKVQASAVAIANFTHNVSRENDPQLHTHSVVLNVVERSTDGKLTALEPQKIYECQKSLDQVYKNELARALQEMGYSIHMTDQHGNFEITGFPEQVLQAFSSRKEQVLETAERLKNEGKIVTENEYTLRDIAALESRPEKQFLSAEQLQAKWDEKLREIGLTKDELKQMVTQSLAQSLTHVSAPEPAKEYDKAIEYVQNAAKIIHENESAFTIEKLTEIALRLSMSDAAKGEKVLGQKDISAAIQGLQQQGWIKEVEQGYFTTTDMQRIEKEILGMTLSGIGRAEKIATKEEIDKAIEKFQTEKGISMTNDQKQAVHHILSSQDKVIGIQGDAGTGKTTSLELIKNYLESQGYTVRAFAPTGKASDELAKVGIRSQTVDSFLSRQMSIATTEDLQKYHELSQKFSFEGKGIPFLRNETGESWIRGEITKQFGYSPGWGVKQYQFEDGARMIVEWNRAGMNVYTRHASGNITVKTFAKADAINSMVQVGEKKYIAPDRAVERGREVWIVDESSMLSSQKMHELLQRAREADARIIFVGDIKQLPGVGAGKMFQELQERGMSTFRMKENIRQVDEEYRQLVRDLADKKFEQVLQRIQIREIPKSSEDGKDDKAKYDAIVRDFMRDPSHTIVVATTNKEVAEINGRIQAELTKRQKKSSPQPESSEDKEPEGVSFMARVSKNLTAEEKRYSFSYAPGDVIFIARKDMKQMGIPDKNKTNEFYVKHVDHKNNTIRIARMGAKDTYEVDLKKWGEKLTVYHEPHRLTVGVGDRLISGKNDREIGIKNGQMWWVSAVDTERGTFFITNKRGVT